MMPDQDTRDAAEARRAAVALAAAEAIKRFMETLTHEIEGAAFRRGMAYQQMLDKDETAAAKKTRRR